MFQLFIFGFWTIVLVHAKDCAISRSGLLCDSSCNYLKVHQSNLSTFEFSTCFPNLEILNASDCGIKSITDLIQNDTLPNLKVLDLSNNSVTSLIKSDLIGFVNLREVNLAHNQINAMPWEILDVMKSLIIVNLSSNKLRNLHLQGNKSANCCPGITVLSLSGNMLKDVKHLKMLSGLKELHLSDNTELVLSSLPFKQLPNLSAITLSKTGLTNTTDLEILQTAKNLQNLTIANNNFWTFDLDEFPKLTKLVYIDLQQLTVIGHLTLKTRFPELKFIKMSADNWKCDDLQEVWEYFEENSIQWLDMDNSIDTKECLKMFVLGNNIWFIFVGVCAMLVVFVVGMAWGIHRVTIATKINVPVQKNVESVYIELKQPQVVPDKPTPKQIVLSKGKSNLSENAYDQIL